MRETHQRLVFMGLATLFLIGGCNKQPPANTAAPAAQPGPASTTSAPASSATSAPASSPSSAGSPTTQPVAEAPAPPVPTQAATPVPPPPPPVYTVKSGTRLSVSINQTLSAKNNNVGDRFRGSLAKSILVSGVTVLSRGTSVSGTVVSAKGQGKFKGEGNLGITLTSVGSQSVTTSDYEQSVSGKGKRSTAMIAGGGGGGALIGGLAGGKKGALIGGLIGAGAGTAGAATTGNKDVVIPAETVVAFTLSSPIRIQGKAPAVAPETSPQ